MCYRGGQLRSFFNVVDFGFHFYRAETERGLSRKHIIEGKQQSRGLLDQMLRMQQQKTLGIISCFRLRESPVHFNNLHSFGIVELPVKFLGTIIA